MSDFTIIPWAPSAQEYFDQRRYHSKTFDEAAHFAGSVEWYRDPAQKAHDQRQHIYLLDQTGWLMWQLNPYTAGIANYNENAFLEPHVVNLDRTIEQKRVLPVTLGFLAMDAESLYALQQNGNFDERKLQGWLGIDKRYTAQRR